MCDAECVMNVIYLPFLVYLGVLQSSLPTSRRIFALD